MHRFVITVAVLSSLVACSGSRELNSALERVEADATAAELAKIDEIDTGGEDAFDLALVLYVQRYERAAAVLLSRVARRHPDDPAVLNNLGGILLNLDEVELALSILEEADDLSPDNAMILGNLGVAEFRLDRFDDARAHLERSMALDRDNPETCYALGRVLEEVGGDPTEALLCSLAAGYTRAAAEAIKDLPGSTGGSQVPAEPPPTPPGAEGPGTAWGLPPPAPSELLQIEWPMLEPQTPNEWIELAGVVGPTYASLGGEGAADSQASLEAGVGKVPLLGTKAMQEAENTTFEACVECRLSGEKAWQTILMKNQWLLDRITDLHDQWAATAGLEEANDEATAITQKMADAVAACAPDDAACQQAALAQYCSDARKHNTKWFQTSVESANHLLDDYVAAFDEVNQSLPGHLATLRDAGDYQAMALWSFGTLEIAASVIGSDPVGFSAMVMEISDKCNEPPAPSPPPPVTGTLKVWGAENACEPKGEKVLLETPVVTMKVGCETVTVEAGSGFVGSLTYNTRTGGGTVFAGAGGSLSLTPAGSALPHFAAKTGFYVTFPSGDTCVPSDMGWKSEAELKLTSFGALGSKTTARSWTFSAGLR